MGQGTSIKGFSKNDLANFPLHFPINQHEQKKIADCLSSLDDLITAENDKLEALKTHKKGLMQQLFPQAGENTPRLRFPEFQGDGEWEGTTLGNICSMQAGKYIKANKIENYKKDNFFPCYGGNGLRGFVDNFNYNGKYPLIGRQGALCGNITLANGQFYATEHAIVVTNNKNTDISWLYYNLNNLNLNQYATGQAQPGLSVDVLKKVFSDIPSNINEQEKIADCLSSLDDLITAQSTKIEHLKTHKKGIMQQLFPKVIQGI